MYYGMNNTTGKAISTKPKNAITSALILSAGIPSLRMKFLSDRVFLLRR